MENSLNKILYGDSVRVIEIEAFVGFIHHIYQQGEVSKHTIESMREFYNSHSYVDFLDKFFETFSFLIPNYNVNLQKNIIDYIEVNFSFQLDEIPDFSESIAEILESKSQYTFESETFIDISQNLRIINKLYFTFKTLLKAYKLNNQYALQNTLLDTKISELKGLKKQLSSNTLDTNTAQDCINMIDNHTGIILNVYKVNIIKILKSHYQNLLKNGRNNLSTSILYQDKNIEILNPNRTNKHNILNPDLLDVIENIWNMKDFSSFHMTIQENLDT